MTPGEKLHAALRQQLNLTCWAELNASLKNKYESAAAAFLKSSAQPSRKTKRTQSKLP